MDGGLRTNSHWFHETAEEAEEIPTAQNYFSGKECSVCSNLTHQRSNPEDNHGNIPIKKSNDCTLLDTQEFNHEAKATGNQALLVPLLTSFSFFRKRSLTKTQPWYQHQWGPIHPLKPNKTTKGRFSGALFVVQLGHILPTKVPFPKNLSSGTVMKALIFQIVPKFL